MPHDGHYLRNVVTLKVLFYIFMYPGHRLSRRGECHACDVIAAILPAARCTI